MRLAGRFLGKGLAVLPLFASAGCQAPSTSPVAPAAAEPVRNAKEATATESPIGPGVIGSDEDEAERWLAVLEAKKGSAGGWATGSFEPERNRVTIRTRDVRRFIVDTRRVSIDWSRLVVLSLDGRTSELRKRDYPVLRFVLDEQGEWVIAEP